MLNGKCLSLTCGALWLAAAVGRDSQITCSSYWLCKHKQRLTDGIGIGTQANKSWWSCTNLLRQGYCKKRVFSLRLKSSSTWNHPGCSRRRLIRLPCLGFHWIHFSIAEYITFNRTSIRERKTVWCALMSLVRPFDCSVLDVSTSCITDTSHMVVKEEPKSVQLSQK